MLNKYLKCTCSVRIFVGIYNSVDKKIDCTLNRIFTYKSKVITNLSNNFNLINKSLGSGKNNTTFIWEYVKIKW